MTDGQATNLLGLLDRCAVALEANATLYRKHMAEDSRRHQLSEKRYAEEKKIQAEAIAGRRRRSMRSAGQTTARSSWPTSKKPSSG